MINRMKRRREPAPPPPTRIPLDDGSREGTDAWRTINGVSFCHWDRWLARLALEEPKGLASIIEEFRRRVKANRVLSEIPEALLAQTRDLGARLAALDLTPATLLDDTERASLWLRDKAFRRIWHASTMRRTEAMRRTPKLMLSARARSGNWAAFPASPAPYLAELAPHDDVSWYEPRFTSSVVRLLDNKGEILLMLARSDDERLAIERAMLTASIDLMERVDDSGDDLGQHFREHEQQYLALLRRYVDREGMLRDLVEVVVWEGYGLFHEADGFLCELAAPQAATVRAELTRLLGELVEADLDYHADKARKLLRAMGS